MYVCVCVCMCVLQTPLPDQEGPSAGSMSSFELMSSKDLAYQMTLYDWELFSCVHEVLTTHTAPEPSPYTTTTTTDESDEDPQS